MREIVRQSGGHVRVYSELGHGATFTVYLPEATRDECDPLEAAARLNDSTVHETILLAEDDAQTREVTRRILARQGYTVLEARDGSDALRIARTHPGPVHLVLSDMMMPGMRGGELGDNLLRLRPGIALVLKSGYTRAEMDRRRMLNESLAFIEKPFTRESLLAIVRKAIETVPARSAA